MGAKAATQLCGSEERCWVNRVHSQWTESARWEGECSSHSLLTIMQGMCSGSRVGKQPVNTKKEGGGKLSRQLKVAAGWHARLRTRGGGKCTHG